MFKWIKNLFTALDEPYKGSNETFINKYTEIEAILARKPLTTDDLKEANLQMTILVEYALTQGDARLMHTLHAIIGVEIDLYALRQKRET